MRFSEFHLQGCRVEPGQVWGSVRLAAIVRDEAPGDLRLTPFEHRDSWVRSSYNRADYFSFLPRAFVIQWESDGSAVASSQTHLGKSEPVKMGKLWKRRSKRQLGFLPQSLAIEGFLVRHFKGPEIAWLDYQRLVRRGSLGVRSEWALPGWYLAGLAEALRVFEFAPNQVGSALFLDEELINCFVCPHPADYARLHDSLLADLYPDHLIHYGYLRDHKPDFPMDGKGVKDLASLRAEFERVEDSKRGEETLRLDPLLGRQLEGEHLFKAGPFHLERFTTKLEENHNFCGEVITRTDGSLEYLKMYRLSRAQSKRLRFLKTLADNDWVLARAAEVLHFPGPEGMVRALVGADLGYLINEGRFPGLGLSGGRT